MNAEVVLREDGELSVEGPVTIDTVVGLVARGAALFNHDNQIVGLGGVTEVDSSAVSMLLEWQREANRHQRRMRFTNMPPKLQSLVRLYGVDNLVRLA
jgi:phospholipid transport system transporter-binding protein